MYLLYRTTLFRGIGAFAATVLLSSAASATVLWRGGFENGHRGEFGRYHAVESNPPRISVVEKPTADGLNRTGSLAARVEVRTGDDARKLDPVSGKQIGSNDYNERAELQISSDKLVGTDFIREGDDLWISWQSMFPKNEWWGQDPKGDGTVFFQIHHVNVKSNTYSGSPPLLFTADNDKIYVTQCLAYLCPEKAIRHSEPLKYDHWYTFTLHTKHSSNPKDGVLELWIDGEKKIDLRTALLFGSDFGNYILTGQYRRPGTARTGVMYADNYVIGTTQADVMPAAPQEPNDPVDSEQPLDPEQPVNPNPQEPIDPDPVEPLDPRDEEAKEEDPRHPGVQQPGSGSDTGEPVVLRGSRCSQLGPSVFALLGLGAMAGLRRRRRQ